MKGLNIRSIIFGKKFVPLCGIKYALPHGARLHLAYFQCEYPSHTTRELESRGEPSLHRSTVTNAKFLLTRPRQSLDPTYRCACAITRDVVELVLSNGRGRGWGRVVGRPFSLSSFSWTMTTATKSQKERTASKGAWAVSAGTRIQGLVREGDRRRAGRIARERKVRERAVSA